MSTPNSPGSAATVCLNRNVVVRVVRMRWTTTDPWRGRTRFARHGRPGLLPGHVPSIQVGGTEGTRLPSGVGSGMTAAVRHVRHGWPVDTGVTSWCRPRRREPGGRVCELDGPAQVFVLRGTAEVTTGGQVLDLTAGQRVDVDDVDELVVHSESGLVELYLPAEAVNIE